MASIVNVLRLAAMGTVCFCSIIVLGTAGHQLYLNSSNQGIYYAYTAYYGGSLSVPYQGFAIAVSVLTLVMVPPLLIIGFIRKGAIFNFVGVEVAVLGLLWILWLSSAADTATNLLFLATNCDYSGYGYVTNANGDISNLSNSCHELQAMHAFSWLNWLILTGYWPFLIVMALIQQSRGNPVWTTPINDVKFTPRVVAVVTPGGGYPLQQQQVVYPPSAPYSPAPVPHQQPYPHGGGGYPKEFA